MLKLKKKNNRPSGRTYGARPAQQHGAGGIRMRAEGGFVGSVLHRLRCVTPLQAAIGCLILLACVAVPVTIALSKNAKPASGSATATASATGGGLSASPSATPEETGTPEPTDATLRQGMTDPAVADIQQRLMALGYMEDDAPTEYYGPVTSHAISLFQRLNSLTVDGDAGAETVERLMSDDAQNYTLMEGDSGDDIKDMQGRLKALGYLDQVTGNFGELTTKAVKDFQKNNQLTADGKVGKKTFELLQSDSAKANFLKYGEQSDEVKTYQKRLKTLGYLAGEPDGKYGTGTVAAVKRFQEVNGLIPDGFLGPDTVSELLSSKALANALVLGMRGSDVESIQKRLKALGYLSNVTGYFGSATVDAVKAFQKRNSLTADGMAGKQTITKLSSSSAKKAASGSSGSSGGKSGGTSGGSSATGSVEALISVAESKLGCKYVSGAKGPSTFDCSGFVYWCLNQAGVRQGYMTAGSWAVSGRYQKITGTSNLQRGDILVFGRKSAGHVGIYLGNGGMIDASSGNGKVIKRSGIWSIDYWKDEFICAFRIF